MSGDLRATGADTSKGTMTPEPHDYGCNCQQCKDGFAAIAAKSPNGEYFFTDAELYELFVKPYV